MKEATRSEPHKILGSEAESYFASILRENGFSVLARNYAVHRVGEIDLIANRAHTLLCIEVKARTIRQMSDIINRPAEESVTRLKKQRIQRCMMAYLSEYLPNSSYEIIYLVAVYYVDCCGNLLHADLLTCD